MTDQFLIALLSSSLVSAAVSTIIAGAFNLRSRQNDFANEYFKIVLQKRVVAYEQLERLAHAFKTCVLDEDNQPYHLPFSKDDDWESAHQLMFDVMQQSLWLSRRAFEKTQELSYLLFRLQPNEGGAIEFGKKNYRAIAVLREEIEAQLTRDLLTLHDIRNFLRSRPKLAGGKDSFREVKL